MTSQAVEAVWEGIQETASRPFGHDGETLFLGTSVVDAVAGVAKNAEAAALAIAVVETLWYGARESGDRDVFDCRRRRELVLLVPHGPGDCYGAGGAASGDLGAMERREETSHVPQFRVPAAVPAKIRAASAAQAPSGPDLRGLQSDEQEF
jgi:hypothetical protein